MRSISMRQLLAISLLLLSTCGHVLTVMDDPPVKAGMAQIVFRYVGNAPLLSGDAKIEINGEQVAKLGAHDTRSMTSNRGAR